MGHAIEDVLCLLQESDIFSLGVLLWEVWSGRAPWPGLSPPQLGRVLVQTGQRLPLTNQHCLIAPVLKTCFGAPVTRLPAAQVSLLLEIRITVDHSI